MEKDPFKEYLKESEPNKAYKGYAYGVVHGYGMQSGTGNTTIGNPDTYFRKENGKYVFVAYTIQQNNLYAKLKEDIEKCFDTSKTGLDITDIEEIICCHTSSNLSAGDDMKLHKMCEAKGITLIIYGIDELAIQIHNQYRSLAKDYLGLSIDTNQILSMDEFVTQYDANEMAAPLNTVFQFRDNEINEIIQALKNCSVIMVTGKAGVGKTRLVLEAIKRNEKNEEYKILCVKNNNLSLYEDLVSATEEPGKYLFFVDDANELAELDQILSYITKKNLGYKIKIIVTVRNYARQEVNEKIKNFVSPLIVEVEPFSNNEIQDFLIQNLNIKNEDYIKKIIRIAEGNPRIAYMAGKVAIEQKNIEAISDVSQLYSVYYAIWIALWNYY